MKILYYSHTFGGPTTTFIRVETDYFNDRAQIKYICNHLPKNWEKRDFVQVLPFNENFLQRKIRWLLWQKDLICTFKNVGYAKRLNAIINDFDPDVIHCQFGYEALSLLQNIENFDSKQFIVHFHGYDASQMMRKKTYVNQLKKYLSKSNVTTISCNQYFLNKFEKEHKIKIYDAIMLKYGIDTGALFNPANTLPQLNEDFIIQVSNLSEKKGQEYTLLAFKKLVEQGQHPDLKLYFTGDGERMPMLRKLTRELELTEKVSFLGYLKPQEIARYLRCAKLFVHHSVEDAAGDMEGIPNSIMEAMAMELPIVSTYHSGIPELVEDQVNGYLVAERDVADYAIKLEKGLRLGRLPINRNKILVEYSKDRHNSTLQSIYATLVSRKQSSK